MPSHRSQKDKKYEGSKPTKKEERLNAHEKQQRKTILLAAGILGGVILVILIIGLIDGYLITPNKVIAAVGDEEITVAEFESKARFTRYQMIQQAVQLEQYIQLYQLYGMTDQANQTQSQINYFNTLLNTESLLSDVVVDSMIEEIIVTNLAEDLGISVSDEEFQAAIEAGFNYYPDGTPTPETFPTTQPLPTLNAEQLLLVTPTATSEPTEIPEPTEMVEEEVESEEEVEPTATATPYTVELFDENYAEYLDKVASANVDEAEFLRAQKYELLREKVFDFITADVPLVTEEQVWARHILVEDVTEVDSILGQLESGEMDFAELALLYSKDEGSAVNGGDLGWFGRGRMVPEFEEAAFSLEEGEISEGIESEFGYHIIQVIAKAEIVSDESTQQQARENFFTEWLASQRESMESEITIDETLLARHTPSHPQLNDPEVFEAIYGITIKEYYATQNAAIQEATDQAATQTAMPPAELITAEPTIEE